MMDRMGCFTTTIGIESAAHRGSVRAVANALVDTGCEFSWIPGDVLRNLGIKPERIQRFLVVDGRELAREVGFAIVHAAGMTTADDVVFAEPDDMVLLGARSLEGLNLRVDPQRKMVVRAGPAITGSVA
jgi:predicted aspartyl protease